MVTLIRLLLHVAGPLLLGAVAGCSQSSNDADPDGGAGSAGTGGASPDALVLHVGYVNDQEQPMTLLGDGDAVHLAAALQGGYVMYVSAQVENLTTEFVDVVARLRDPETDIVHTEDERTVVMRKVPDDPARMQPDLRTLSQVSHLVACPNREPRDILDAPWVLELTVEEVEGAGRAGEARLAVVPTCSLDEPALQELCECQCEGGYELGKCPPG